MSITEHSINIYEAVRIIIAGIVFALSVFSVVFSHLGELMIPRARRHAVKFRRRFQMTGFAIMAAVSAAQSLYVATITEPSVMTTPAITNSLTHIILMIILLVLTSIHIGGWWYESTVIKTPLQPDSIERQQIIIELSRQIRHTSDNALQVLSGYMELVLEDPGISPKLKAEIEQALSSADSLRSQISTLGNQAKEMEPPSDPPK